MTEFATPTIPAIAVLIIVGVVVFFVLVIWSIRHHRDPELRVDSDASVDDLIPSLAGLTHSTAVEGNSVEVLENGAFFDVLVDEIAAAKRSVHFENFLWKEGVLGKRIADALSAQARAGVTVRVLLDANGCRKVGKAVERQLKEAGCKLVKFHGCASATSA